MIKSIFCFLYPQNYEEPTVEEKDSLIMRLRSRLTKKDTEQTEVTSNSATEKDTTKIVNE